MARECIDAWRPRRPTGLSGPLDSWTPRLWGPEVRLGPELRHGQLAASRCLGRPPPGRCTQSHLVKQLIQAQVSNSWPHLIGRGQLAQAVPGKFTKLHLLKKMMQVSNSGSHLSGQLLLAVPGKFTKLHLLKKMIQGSGLTLRAPPKWVWAAAASSSWQVHQITFTRTNDGLKLRAPPKWAWAAAAGSTWQVRQITFTQNNDTGSGLKLRVPPKWVWAAAAGSAWQVHQITFTQKNDTGSGLQGSGLKFKAPPQQTLAS